LTTNTLCNFFHFYCKLLSLCMWQYESYCSINTRYVPVFTFTSLHIHLPSISLNNLSFTA